jgi:hypothetical protein
MPVLEGGTSAPTKGQLEEKVIYSPVFEKHIMWNIKIPFALDVAYACREHCKGQVSTMYLMDKGSLALPLTPRTQRYST